VREETSPGRSDGLPASAAPPGRSTRSVALGALVGSFALFAVLEVSLLVLVPASALHHDELRAAERLSLLGLDLLSVALVVLVVGVPLGLAARLLAPLVSRRPRLRRAAAGAGFLAAWGIASVYGTSWGLFRLDASFLDRAAIRFWLDQPIQVFYWAPGPDLYAIPLLALGLATVWTWLLRSLRGASWAEHRPAALASGGLVLLAALAAVGGAPRGPRLDEMVRDQAGTAWHAVGDAYRLARRARAGAFAHGLAELTAWARGDGVTARAADGVEVVSQPLVTMERYLATVDRSRVRAHNVIIVLVESLRPDQLRVLGAERDVMPAVDALARESRVFRHAYSQASDSAYADPCPLSSHYPLRAYAPAAYPASPTYPRVLIYDVLKALGYRVGFFSSSNEHWGGLINYWDTGSIDHLHHPGTWRGPTYVAAGDPGFSAWVMRHRHAGSIDDRYTVEEAARWIDQEARPFFLYLNLQSSHFPYYLPPNHPRKFGPERVDFPMSFFGFPRERVETVKALYADSLHYVDLQLGKLFAHLRTRGLWDRTIVVLSGDNGQAFLEHGLATHGNSVFEEAMRVPLVVRAPGLAPGVVDAPAQHVDVPPTIHHLLGLPPHPSYQGLDLLGAPVPPDRPLFLISMTARATLFAVVRDRRKLIYDPRASRYLLYDLRADPGETRDLARERPELRNRLAAELLTWMTAQVEYYRDEQRHRVSYPPHLVDRRGTPTG
jgi:arylsulfatase A-like enzyme